MAHVFSLTDNSTTISLTASGVSVLRYDIQPPDMRQMDAPIGGDGNELTRPSYQNVTESIEILISDSTIANVRAKGNAIEVMLGKARDSRRLLTLARIYIQAQISGESDTWRSEILAGRLTWIDAIDGVPKLNARATLVITRRYYWEGPETAIELASALDTTATTDPVRFTNDQPGASDYRNHFDAQGGFLTTHLPTPLKLRLTNTEAGAQTIRNLYVCNTAFYGASSNLIVAGTANELAHGASYTTGSSSNLLAYQFDLPDTVVASWGGRYARILVGFDAAFDGYMQSGLAISNGGVTTYRNEQVQAGDRLLDIGAVPIPPGRDMPNPAGVSINIWAQKTGGYTTNVRYIQMTPIGEGLFRRIFNIGELAQTWSIVDDGILGTTYLTDGAGDSYIGVHAFQSPVDYFPGMLNRYRVLYHTATGLGAGNQMTAQAWARPRRLTI